MTVMTSYTRRTLRTRPERSGHRSGGRGLRAGPAWLPIALAALFAGTAAAQTTETLVSNLDQTAGENSIEIGNDWEVAQGFTTGSNADGYTLTSIEAKFPTVNSSPVLTVTLHKDAPTSTAAATLTNPASITAGTLAFTAPADTTLEKDTTYYVLFNGDNLFLRSTTSDDEDAGGLSGWSVEDVRFLRNDTTTGAFTENAASTPISVKGTVVSTDTASTDATLSDLELQDTADDSDIALTPTFAAATTSYTAMVANDVDQILVDPTTTDDGATVEFLDENDMDIDDAESMEDGHQVALAEGDNTIKVKVTAENTMTTQTYTVVVTRAAAVTTDTVLVSNTGQTPQSGAVNVGDTDKQHTQQFTTGSNLGGYNLDSVGVHVNGEDLEAGEEFIVHIYTVNNSGGRDSLVHTLTSPASYTDGDVNLFTAPAGAELNADTDYLVVFEGTGDTANDFSLSQTIVDAEDSGAAAGWSIANARRRNGNLNSAGNSFMIGVNGSEASPSTDATLSSLSLADFSDNSAVTLSPTFSPGDLSYTASVDFLTDAISIDATPGDIGATFEYLNSVGNAIADAAAAAGHQIRLAEGANTIEVKVTAEDTMTVQTYTVVVTREESTATIPVSNLSQTANSAGTVGTTSRQRFAQKFTIPAGADYNLSDITIKTSGTYDNIGLKVDIREVHANNVNDPKNSALYSLRAPAILSGAGEKTFFAPDNTTLDAGESYFVVVSGIASQTAEIRFSSSDNEDSGGLADWSIDNNVRWTTQNVTGWSSSNTSILMRLRGTEKPASTDATLSDLELQDTSDDSDIALTPTFATATTSYTAMVANDVAQILVNPTTTDDGATVEFFDVDDMDIDDADGVEDGHQINLAVGETTIKVKVTAEDTTTDETYEIVVTRAAATPEDTLVSNTSQTSSSTSRAINAQAFTTGSASTGYTLTSVGVALGTVGALFEGDGTLVRIFSVDSSGEPDSLQYTLSNPASFAENAVNFFTAPADATLDADTAYAVVVTDAVGDSLSEYSLDRTTSMAEDAGASAGWSIADTRYWSTTTFGTWTSDTELLKISIQGDVSTASTDATLSDLELQDTSDSSVIALTPTFATATTSYTAMVANDVDEILVAPTTNDDGATVEFLDADDMDIADANTMDDGHQVALAVGDNTIKVKVTAEDTTSEETYTVVVTRAEETTTATVLVSNFGESGSATLQGLGSFKYAQRFSTGTAGSTLEDVSIDIETGTTDNFSVAIHEPDSVTRANPASSALYPLSAPAVSGSGRQVYTAPDNAELDGSANYFVVVSSSGNHALQGTSTGNQTGKAGWSIANTSRLMVTSWTSQGTEMLIRLRGVVGTSTDATLSALALQDTSDDSDIALTPTFAADVISYTAMVANGVDEILVDPTTNDDGATVEFLDADDMAIADANAADGHQVDLAEGDNTIKVKVTAEDTMATETYTLVVTRALEVSVLVSNTGRSHDDTSDVAGTAMGVTSRLAQGFTTGDNLGGYALDRVRIALDAITGSENALVSIYSNSGGSPDSLLHTLVSPTSYPPLDEFYEFDAPATATLDASTTYHIVIEASSGNFFIGFTAADGEDPAGEDDWSLADSRQRSDDGAAWASHAESLRVRVFGSERTPSTDATLSDLELFNTGDSSAIGVFPSFAPEVTSYSTWQRNDVPQITLTPSLNDGGATVEYLNANDLAIDDANTVEDGQQINLAEGFNIIKIKVTAEDTLTTETYTLLITRLAPILVNNLDQTHIDHTPTDTPAQAFTTGPNPGGYEIGLAWANTQNQGTAFSASIWTTNANAEPDTLLYSLTAPDIFVGFAVFFSAPENARLDPDTTYSLVLDTPASGLALRMTTSNSESTDSASGWSIGDAAHFGSSGTWTVDPDGDALHVGLGGRELAASTDATLSDLDLSWDDSGTETDIALTPTFATATTSYTAMVANGVDEILVDPTTTDDGATVEFLDADDMDIADAGAMEDGHQVALAEGDNTIKVKVTAQDTMATETYTLVVTRQESTATVLVANLDQAAVVAFGVNSSSSVAQKFTVASGSNYTIDDITIDADGTGNDIAVAIHADASNSPGDSLFVFEAPSGSTSGLQVYTVADDTVLSASDSYFVVVRGTSSTQRDVQFTNSDDEDGVAGWGIGNTHLRTQGVITNTASSSLKLRLRGDETAASTDATLSGLSLQNAADSTAIDLTPTFDVATRNYAAVVANPLTRVSGRPDPQ